MLINGGATSWLLEVFDLRNFPKATLPPSAMDLYDVEMTANAADGGQQATSTSGVSTRPVSSSGGAKYVFRLCCTLLTLNPQDTAAARKRIGTFIVGSTVLAA